MLRVTLDTNTIDHRPLIDEACAGLDVELSYTTVTDRESEGTSRATSEAGLVETDVWDESRWGQPVWGGPVRKSFILDESRLDEAARGGDESQSTLERILEVIGSGSFPPQGGRESLSRSQRRQLRDAMILEAHARDGRDVLVSEDATAYINHGRRELLETICRTRIMTVGEFCDRIAGLCVAP